MFVPVAVMAISSKSFADFKLDLFSSILFVTTIFAARQFVSHGQVKVNGKKVTIPSYNLQDGDIIEVKEKSRDLPIVLEAISSTERDAPEYLSVDYDKFGKVKKGAVDAIGATYDCFAPIWAVAGLVIRIAGTNYKIKETADIKFIKWTAAATGTASTQEKAGTEKGYALVAISDLVVVSTGAVVVASAGVGALDGIGQVNGSQWSEASGAPDGFRDELTSVEFFTQIFKTAVPLMSGSMMATKYRGYANEWSRIYAEHLKAHKMDLENAFLFGYGQYRTADNRTSWGMVPFLSLIHI